MIYPNSVESFIYTLLSSDSSVVNSNLSVDLNELYNLDPNRTPWIGIYGGNISIEPHRAQIAHPWLTNYNLKIYVQAVSFDSGQNAKDLLDRTLSVVMTAIDSNRTLGSTVDMCTGYDIDPFQRDIEKDLYYYTDELTIHAENRE